jgi:hypothetical protein
MGMAGSDGRCPNEFVAANYKSKRRESAGHRIASNAAFAATSFPDPFLPGV